ncbi:hypothetical protein CPT_Metamorpho_009 [Klebsiella phage Metamorpho]|nr:hypothetical protein CPT_Metamorpho_009 [Klebsiella phage Metamorpho]
MKAVISGIWAALCIATITSGEVSVIQQAIAQGTLAVVVLLDFLKND